LFPLHPSHHPSIPLPPTLALLPVLVDALTSPNYLAPDPCDLPFGFSRLLHALPVITSEHVLIIRMRSWCAELKRPIRPQLSLQGLPLGKCLVFRFLKLI
jgi:hypothetical protein